MDWGDIKAAGLSCYNIKRIKERKRYYIYLLRCALHRNAIGELDRFFHATSLRQDVLHGRPCLLEQATRAFFYKGSTVEERVQLIEHHISFLEQQTVPDFLRTIYTQKHTEEGRITLWQDTFQDQPLTLDLLFHPGQRKEGCLSLVLHLGTLDFYQLMFWLAPTPDTGKPCCWVGALQGTTLGKEAVKAMTKQYFGYRTKNLIFYGLRTLADFLGCSEIRAVTNAGYYAMNHLRMDRKLKTNFGDFWAECGGTPSADPRFYQIPLEKERRDLSEFKPSKRANHRRRYALMDAMRKEICEKITPYLASPVAKKNNL